MSLSDLVNWMADQMTVIDDNVAWGWSVAANFRFDPVVDRRAKMALLVSRMLSDPDFADLLADAGVAG